MVKEELSSCEIKRMKNRPYVPNLIKLQGLKAIEIEKSKVFKTEKQNDDDKLVTKETKAAKEKIPIEEELSEGL